MTDYPLRSAVLDEEGCAAVHAATIELLEHTGVEVQHDEALALLQKAGARVDGTRVRIPRALVDDALFAAPRSIPLASRSDAPGITLEAGPITTAPGRTASSCWGRRPGAPPGISRRRRGDGRAPGEAARHRLRHVDGAPARAERRVRPGRAVRRHAARHVQAADHGAGGRHRRRVVQGDGRRVRRRRQLGGLRDAHAAARARAPLGRAPHTLRRARRPDGLRRRVPAGRHGARLTRRLPVADQRRDAQRAGHRRARQVRRALRVRSDPRSDERAHRPRALLRAGGDGQPAGLRRPRPILRPADVRLRRLLGFPHAGRAVGVRGRHDAAHGGRLRRHVAPRPRVRRLRHRVQLRVGGADGRAGALGEGVPGGRDRGRRGAGRGRDRRGGSGRHAPGAQVHAQHVRDYLQPDLVSQDQYDGWVAAGASSLLDRAAARTRELRESERAYAPAPDALRELDALVERARAADEA